MKSNRERWLKGKKHYYVLFLFVVAAILAVYLMPSHGKFKYEYQKGTPWQHESLIASFDFAIRKSDKELKRERDSVLKNVKPYFVYNTEVEEEQINKFSKEYDLRFKDASVLTKKLYPEITIPDSAYNFCKNLSVSILKFIYDKGVIDYTEENDNIYKSNSLVIVKNNIAEPRNIDDVFTPKIAYGYINNRLKKDYPEKLWLLTLFDNLKIYDFVVQNLSYDDETTKRISDDLLNNIPTTRGMVQAGERIIARGEVVSNEKFRILESLRKEYQGILGSNEQIIWLYVGHSVIVLLLYGLLFVFLLHFRKEVLDSSRKTIFILLMILMMVATASMVVRFTAFNIYLVPFVALPIIVYAFYDARMALYLHVITILLTGFLAPNAFEFVFLQFVAGAVSIFSVSKIYRRGQLFVSVGLIILSYIVAYSAIGLIQEGMITQVNYKTFLWFGGNGLLLLASYPLIFLFEKIFGFLSDATLLELSDTNNPILRELAEKAPGTFQHVIQVSNLAEEAIRRIGGNTLLMRVGALYHDIGKIGAPGFFIENQIGKNPHEDLDYEKSASVIVEHVNYGVELAKKYNLPKPIIDFITTHHGEGVVKYFYTKYANENNGEVPDISKFSYPGPAPFTKETAVLMMADAVEAASRTLKEYNEKTIGELVDKIINSQLEDKQFEEADITFKDITTVKEVFKQKLLNIYHARIEYPEKKK